MSNIRHTRTRSAGIPIAANASARPPPSGQSQLKQPLTRASSTRVASTASSRLAAATTAASAAKRAGAGGEGSAAAAGPSFGTTSSSSGSGSGSGTPWLSIFLTNVKLLDLDTRQDCPGITAETFAGAAAPTTGAIGARRGVSVQGQKKRLQCAEWALYHLFALWDPEETKNKLKPFFPPLNQVQSTNLRAAILRALEQAKKNAVLGRDTIIRKTMLDECRGERFEEVLASFSSAVLKKVTAESYESEGGVAAAPIAARLALQKRGYKDETTELQVLDIAHRASLRKLLSRKKAAAARYRDFADFLDVKERSIVRRKEEIAAAQKDEDGIVLLDDARLEMVRNVRNNWAGNEQWMRTLLQGDDGASGHGLMDMSFERVWRRVEQGRLAEVENGEAGLLEQLEGRVKAQNDRLRKWDAFRRKNFGGKPAPSPSKPKMKEQKQRGIDLGFGQHENLQLGRMSPKKLALSAKSPPMNSEYKELLQGLQDELDGTTETDAEPLAFLKKRRFQRPRFAQTYLDQAAAAEEEYEEDAEKPSQEDEISEMSDLDAAEDMFAASAEASPTRSLRAKLDSAKRLPVRPKLSHPTGSQTSTRSSSSSKMRTRSKGAATRASQDQDMDLVHDFNDRKPGMDKIAPVPLARQPSPVGQSRRMSPPPPPIEAEELERPTSPMQDLADQILESMDNASPSPSKRSKPRHTLSLAERTRLSMARGSNAFFHDDEPELPSSISVKTKTTSIDDKPLHPSAAAPEEPDDLVSRTRKSMAGFDKARQKAQVERRRSLRRSRLPPARREGSLFPGVTEEEEGQGDQSMLAEELMGADEDMEAVFRSRPKIKASPLPSPTRELEEWDS